jgi:hypothetical protein
MVNMKSKAVDAVKKNSKKKKKKKSEIKDK